MFTKSTNTFRHGIHPPEHKETTNGLPIKQFPFAPELIIPLVQHIGAPSKLVVREGQEVERGQLLAEAGGYVSVPLHAPESGTIRKIGRVPTISGQMVDGIYLTAAKSSSQEVIEGEAVDLETATPEEILAAIQNAGIVGLGGAAFPTHVKLKVPEGKKCEVLLINGIVVFSNKEVSTNKKIYPCIKCGACVDACPIFLNPSKLGILAKAEGYAEMAENYNLMDCFECGSCSYVCPSNIPLVQYFRLSKAQVRQQKQKEVMAND